MGASLRAPYTKGTSVATLLTAGAVALVALQAPSRTVAQVPAVISTALAGLPATPYLNDLVTALGATSEAVKERAALVEAARVVLSRAVAGVSVVAEATPTLEFERDLSDPTDQGAWTTDIDVGLNATYRRDAVAVARARLALVEAEARLRGQLRDDLQRSLLALSTRRLAERSLEDAVLAATEAAAALREAEAAGTSAADLLPLQVAAELASNGVERARAEAEAAAVASARLGLTGSAPATSALLGGDARSLVDLAPAALTAELLSVPAPEQHSRAKTLALELALALAQSRATPFTVLREIEVYGAYENTGFEVEGRVAVVTGVPLVGAGVSWTNGADDVGFVVGVGATLRLTDATARDGAAAALAVEGANGALAAFLDSQVTDELTARRAAELEFEDFALTRAQLAYAEGQSARAEAEQAPDREIQRLRTAVRRAQDATERAWQRYVRSLVDYLSVADAVWRSAGMEER